MTFVSTQNWAQFDVAPVKEKKPEFDWNITVDQWSSYEEAFHGIKPLHGFISGTFMINLKIILNIQVHKPQFLVLACRKRNAGSHICMTTQSD